MNILEQIFKGESYTPPYPQIIRQRAIPRGTLRPSKKVQAVIYLPTNLVGRKVVGIVLQKVKRKPFTWSGR